MTVKVLYMVQSTELPFMVRINPFTLPLFSLLWRTSGLTCRLVSTDLETTFIQLSMTSDRQPVVWIVGSNIIVTSHISTICLLFLWTRSRTNMKLFVCVWIITCHSCHPVEPAVSLCWSSDKHLWLGYLLPPPVSLGRRERRSRNHSYNRTYWTYRDTVNRKKQESVRGGVYCMTFHWPWWCPWNHWDPRQKKNSKTQGF